ncbi:MAG: polysaccharide deacetylase [Armatimonadota bacterium]|nr:MAG: polysaccharide deacetylase [Armatimonadota bacterium]
MTTMLKHFVKSLVALRVYRACGESLWEKQRGILILMYQEVASKRDERFRLFPVLCTTPETFRQQIEWLQKRWEVISIDDVEGRLREGTAGDSRAVVITSDDGWAGFYTEAMSLGIQATVYVTTCVLEGRLPWYVRWRLLLKENPFLLKPLAHELGDFEPFPNADTAVDRLKRLDIARIEWLWESMAKESGFREERLPTDWFMSREQVRQTTSGAITIGSHTVHHPLLTHERSEVALDELRESKRVLEGLTGQPVRHFAYPNGDHDDRIAALVAEAGYATAATTQSGWNLPGEHLYRLKRVDVHEAACVDHRGRFSEAMFALWITGEWMRVKSKLRFLS